ncbi:MAG: hypothetical protein RLZZ234_70 [Candidatus Parcubacteria bacterium]|jgi:hypothetical protein
MDTAPKKTIFKLDTESQEYKDILAKNIADSFAYNIGGWCELPETRVLVPQEVLAEIRGSKSHGY